MELRPRGPPPEGMGVPLLRPTVYFIVSLTALQVRWRIIAATLAEYKVTQESSALAEAVGDDEEVVPWWLISQDFR